MKPLFTVHAGEYLVASYIEENFKNLNVWVPSKDSGTDLLVTNKDNAKAVSIQVKFSKDFLVATTSDKLRQGLIAGGWWTPQRLKIEKSKADFWILVLHNIFYKKVQFIIIQPREYLVKLTKIHGKVDKIQTYLTVTKKNGCWETRGISRSDQEAISNNRFENSDRDFTKYLNNWEQIKVLL